VERRKLGKLSEVGVIGLGVEHLKKKAHEEIVEVIREAIRLGVNYLDLIWSYPHVITAIGDGLKGNRDKVTLAAHLGSCYRGDKYIRSRTVNRCRETFEEVLDNLETGNVDIINLHYLSEKDWKKVFEPGGILDLARDLVDEGKARSIGASTHDISILRRIAPIPEINSVMFQVNMVNHRLTDRDEVLKMCMDNGKGIVAMKPFAKGKLLRPKKKEKMASYTTGGIRMEARIPVSMTSAKCLHYVLSQPGVSVTVPGAANLEELRDCVNYVNVPLDEKTYDSELEELFLNEIS